ncbi:MAG TPA: DNA translocase FtsK [Spirochaetota bacterium]
MRPQVQKAVAISRIHNPEDIPPAPKGVTPNRIVSLEKESFIESAIPVRYIDIKPLQSDEFRRITDERTDDARFTRDRECADAGLSADALRANACPCESTGFERADIRPAHEVEEYVKAAEDCTRSTIVDSFENAYHAHLRERGGDDEEVEIDDIPDDGEVTSRARDDDDEDELEDPDDGEITARQENTDDDDEPELDEPGDDEITSRTDTVTPVHAAQSEFVDDDDEDDFETPGDDEVTSQREDEESAAREKIAKLEKSAAVRIPSDDTDFDDDEIDALPSSKVFDDIPINEEYIIPSTFLQISPKHDRESWESEIRRNSELLVKTLNDFGIESRVSMVNRGPVVTLYEMQLAPGIKVTRIVSLADDIALALAASRVRVVAPIPGKSAIGIEVPNSLREMVTLGDIINTSEYISADMMLKIAMGKDILGKPVMIDLKKQPHLLIAGATGAGKSVCVNGVIVSLICNYDPNHLRFIMIDPKMVELQLYNGLPHLLTPVITDPDDAPKALKWAIMEMERRYRLLSDQCTRDIDKYNQKIASMRHPEEFEHLPYIVVIIDEFADLMMVAAKEVENYVTRIAQKARAIGIHLVLATQRPSVDIITGIIKANFPARVAFQVAQKTDSRTIIDQNGAEKLLGRGDMLYQSPNSSFPVRVQGAYLSEDEIMSIVKRACTFGRPRYIDFDEFLKEEAASNEDGDDIRDELFADALKIVSDSKKASASYLQRRLSIGYNRAARIVERMEELGYVGPQQGSKPREVFV